MAQGIVAAAAIAGDLGLKVPQPAAARRTLGRSARFQAALWRLFEAPPFDPGAIDDSAIVCRCEEVTAGELRQHDRGRLRHAGRAEARVPGRHGPLPGPLLRRRCVARMTTDEVDEFGLFAPRPPAKPVPIHALSVEQPEWSGHKDFVPPDMARPRETEPLPARDGRHAGDRRRRRRLLPRLLAGARGHRDAGGRARRREPAGLRRQCRQPARAAPGLRLCPGRTARQSRRRHAAAWAGLGGAVAGDPARHRPRTSR